MTISLIGAKLFGFNRVIEYDAATDRMVAEAVLAGYSVTCDVHSRLYPWRALYPGGGYISRYVTEREAWAAAWHKLQDRLETTGQP